jgi:predicted ATP-grasp superfamily ATP-dependent carboligase
MAVDTPSVVVGAGINGLGVVRSLVRANVPTWLLDVDIHRPEMYVRGVRRVQVATLHGGAMVDELVRVASGQFAGVWPVLLLTQEESVKLVSNARDRLSPLYRFSLPPRDTLDALQHKHGFQRLAEQHACPIPPLVNIHGPDDMHLLDSLQYPVVIKPGARHTGYSRQFKKAYRSETARDAADLIRRMLPVLPDIVVQEWTEGPDSNIYFCLQYIDGDGHATASFTGRKVRSWPPQVGGTASCTAAPEAHAELSALTTRFFRDVGAIGMAAMEYKRDVRTGKFRAVEPTIGRTDYQAEVATLNGVNLPYAAYCAETGAPLGVQTQSSRRWGWRVRTDDDQSAALQHQNPRDGFGDVAGVADALWRGSDPAPYLVEAWQRIARGVRKRLAPMPNKAQTAKGRT